MKLQFLGATGTVTGSKYLLESGSTRILVDCGLFQGLKELRLRNWDKLPLDPASLDAVVLTHAHLDHCGYFPLLVKQGFSGKLYCTSATRDLAEIILLDSGRLQEEEADFQNRHKISKHHPALPLYTEEDAKFCLERFQTVAFESTFTIKDLVCKFRPAGHILGAASLLAKDERTSVLFSGDLGRPDDLIMKAPLHPVPADYFVIESTYGDRLHGALDPVVELGQVLQRGLSRGGVVLIPAFSVGRTQHLLYAIHQLFASGRVQRVPVYLNSPMSISAMDIYNNHPVDHRLSAAEARDLFNVATYIRDAQASKELNTRQGPMIIVSASGMLTGGRILHHVQAFAGDARNVIILAGFQAAGTRGAALAAGAREIRIFGEMLRVEAEVIQMESFSAHADQAEMMRWLSTAEKKPRKVFITHGESGASEALAAKIGAELHWQVEVPSYLQSVAL